MNNEPPFLYRAFKEREHANQFLNGKIRFGSLDYYQSSADESRQDSFEGESSAYLGNLRVRGKGCNPTFLLSTAGPAVDLSYLRETFGNFVVKITNPGQFREDISNVKAFVPEVNVCGGCDFRKVEYTKDQDQPIDVRKAVKLRLYYCQKPLCFFRECEYRYVVQLEPGNTPGNFICCDFRRGLDYLEML